MLLILNISNTTVQNSTDFIQRQYFSDDWWHLKSIKIQFVQLSDVRKNNLKLKFWVYCQTCRSTASGWLCAFVCCECIDYSCIQMLPIYMEWPTHSRWNHLTVHTPGSRIKSSSKSVRKSKSSPTKYSSLLYAAIFVDSSRCVFPTMHFASPMSLSFGSEIYELCGPGGGLRGLW